MVTNQNCPTSFKIFFYVHLKVVHIFAIVYIILKCLKRISFLDYFGYILLEHEKVIGQIAKCAILNK